MTTHSLPTARPTSRRTRTLAGLAGAAVVSLLLAGCGGNGVQSAGGSAGSSSSGGSDGGAEASSSASPSSTPSTPASSPSPAPSTSSPSSASASTAAPSAAAGAGASPSGPAVCTTSHLRVGLNQADGGGAAGSQFVLLTFRNTGSSPCFLDGHPGVSFVGGGDGRQIGTPAARTGSTRRVTLAAGQSTTAVLQVADAGNYDASTCAPTTSDGLRVYPPDSRASVFVRYRTQACQGSTGSSPQLQVSAVGRAQG